MEESQAKCFLCMTALCLSPTQRDANLLRALGAVLQIQDRALAGALTMIGTASTANQEPHETMLERAEHQAAGLRSTLTPQAALEGFSLLLLLFIQGGGGGEDSSSSPFKAFSSSGNSNFTHMIKFDARTSVILRRLAFLLRIKLSTVCALEELAIFNLEQEATKLQQKEESAESKNKKNLIRGLKIGAAATAAGGLLAVTGGLAAPALATGLASLGLGTVAAVTTTATVSALLGAGGAGLGAYKMTRRTAGVQHFEFQSINDETLAAAVHTKSTFRVANKQNPSSSSTSAEGSDEKLKGMTVYICISGYLRAAGPTSNQDGNLRTTSLRLNADNSEQHSEKGGSSRRKFGSNLKEKWQSKKASMSKKSTSSSPIGVGSSSSESVATSVENQSATTSQRQASATSSPRKTNSNKIRDAFFTSNKSAAHSPDFFAPWGAQPRYLYDEEILDRFYSVVAPEKRKLVPLLLQTYEGQEDDLMDELARRYNGMHPKQLCPMEARRDYFQGNSDEQKILKSLLFRAGMKLQELASAEKKPKQSSSSTSSTSIPEWQYPEASLKLLMDTERTSWDSFKDAKVHYLIDVDNAKLTKEQKQLNDSEKNETADNEKSKEEMDEIIADLFQKFQMADEEANQGEGKKKASRASLGTKTFQDTALLEAEKYKIRLTPTNNIVDISESVDTVELGHKVYWWRDKVARYGDQYTLIWEPELLLQVGECVQSLIKESVSKGALSSLQFTALSALYMAMALPVVITAVVSTLDNYWTLAVAAADEAGQLMAEALMSDAHGNRPVVLIGYSVGGRVVASCLEALAQIASGGQDNDDIINVDDLDDINAMQSSTSTATTRASTSIGSSKRRIRKDMGLLNQKERQRRRRAASIVRDAVIIGAPCDTSMKKWTQRRSVVVGRLINVYSPKDWVLALLYRYKSWSVLSLAGLQKVESKPSFLHSPIENYNVSNIVNGHGDYHSKIQELLSHIGIGDVDSEKFHCDYFATN